jgi:anti-anti-sigma regulatory factor
VPNGLEKWEGTGVAEAATVDDLRPGDHVCLTFTDADERLDLVAAFVRDGLATGRRVLCFVESIWPDAFSADLTERGLVVDDPLRSGQLVVATSSEHYLPGGGFAADQALNELDSQVRQATRDGYTGLWLTADMCWALRPVSGVDELATYESQVAGMLEASGAIAVCQYDRQRFDAVTLATVTSSHTRAVAAVTYHDDALLRICRQYVPPGVRVAGELDFRYVEPLSRALAEAVALHEHVHVNLRQLRFIDGACAGVIAQAAAGLADHQRMTVTCGPLVSKVLLAIGADEIARMRVVVRDGDQ